MIKFFLPKKISKQKKNPQQKKSYVLKSYDGEEKNAVNSECQYKQKSKLNQNMTLTAKVILSF